MPLTAAAKDSMLDHLGTLVTHLSLHTVAGSPGSTGANEVTGGSPAYARKACSWSAASGGSKALAASATFDVPAGTTVRYIGLWSASSGGTFRGYYDLTADGQQAYASQGTLTVTAGTVDLLAVANA